MELDRGALWTPLNPWYYYLPFSYVSFLVMDNITQCLMLLGCLIHTDLILVVEILQHISITQFHLLWVLGITSPRKHMQYLSSLISFYFLDNLYQLTPRGATSLESFGSPRTRLVHWDVLLLLSTVQLRGLSQGSCKCWCFDALPKTAISNSNS